VETPSLGVYPVGFVNSEWVFCLEDEFRR
jgi:hypothetical protein